jgi:PAS domain S-box-containing protein
MFVIDSNARTPLRVLIVEDSEDDAQLILRELRRGGLSPRWTRVDTAESMRTALEQERWDVVISDYKIPGFGGLAALGLLKQRDRDVPFILASGVIGEEVAVEAMRAGADDYVMKRNLARLPPVIEREVREAEVRRRRRRAEEALQRQLLFTRALSDSIGEGVCAIDRHGRLTFANPAAQRMLGWSEAELIGRELHEWVHPDRDERVCPILDVMRSHAAWHGDDDVVRTKGGALIPVSLTASPLSDGLIAGGGAVLAFQNIQERKRLLEAEHFLAGASEALAELLDWERALARTASLCVPAIADLCAVAVAADDESFLRVAVGVPDIGGADAPAEVTRRRSDDASRPFLAPPSALEEHATAPAALLRFVAGSAGRYALLEESGPFASLRLALRSRGHTLGSLVLLTRAGRAPPDAPLAQELAHRAAMAIDNARLYNEAQTAIRVRDDFLSIASHELRTPLTPLRLQIQDLLERSRTGRLAALPPERLTAWLESASRQIDRVARLVSNLLDVTRILGGRVVLEREETDLVAVVREVCERAEPEAARANQRIELDTDGPEPVVGRWDRLRLDQIVTNVLSNALKYGEGKPIEVSVRRAGDHAILRVRDHGIGIPPEQIDRIFGRFERAVSERAYSGLGLGLYIVRRFVEAHGGTVRVESQPGEGSTFTVELPLG